MLNTIANNKKVFYGVASLVFVAIIGYGGYRYYILRKVLRTTIAVTAQTTSELNNQINTLGSRLTETEGDNMSLTDALHTSQNTIAAYQSEIQKLTGDVGTLQKLTQTDPELLKKYSKVYFLNEHYIPASLTTIETPYLSTKDRVLQIQTKVWPHLKALLDDSTTEGLDLRISSAYRSFNSQAVLKSNYKVIYGTTAANKFSAEQGYSEHQLGTTIDMTTVKLVSLTQVFDKSPEFTWLTNNAYRYGFILSYPKNNNYYVYEPWHWRFVGVDLATKLHESGTYLYDLDQREIDGYLVSIFD
jgi:LAS superfamily LD-carboxypeptidase LdcB